jgi:hypothetical protein
VRWLVPALAVMAATAAIGALRYRGLPAHVVNGPGHRVSKAAVSVLIVAGLAGANHCWQCRIRPESPASACPGHWGSATCRIARSVSGASRREAAVHRGGALKAPGRRARGCAPSGASRMDSAKSARSGILRD